MAGSDDSHIWRPLSPDELKAGGDAGVPKGCVIGDRVYADGTVLKARKGYQKRCTDGVWVEEAILDPTDPWS